MTAKLLISKFDAAKRQLECAVRLFFFEGDPVAIHTLVAAGYNVLRDANKAIGGDPLLIKEGFKEYVYPDKIKYIIHKMNEAENFFKHADNDPNSILEFAPEQTEFLMWEACLKYRELSSERTPIFELFISWFYIQRPNLFQLSEESSALLMSVSEDYKKYNRQKFFTDILQLLMRQGIDKSL